MSKRKKALGAVRERGVVPDLSGPPRCAPLYTTLLHLHVEREPKVDPTGGAARCADGAGRGMEREELDAHAPEHAYCEVRDKDKAAADGDEKKQPLLSTRTCPSTHTARCATKTKRRMVMRRNHC